MLLFLGAPSFGRNLLRDIEEPKSLSFSTFPTFPLFCLPTKQITKEWTIFDRSQNWCTRHLTWSKTLHGFIEECICYKNWQVTHPWFSFYLLSEESIYRLSPFAENFSEPCKLFCNLFEQHKHRIQECRKRTVVTFPVVSYFFLA